MPVIVHLLNRMMDGTGVSAGTFGSGSARLPRSGHARPPTWQAHCASDGAADRLQPSSRWGGVNDQAGGGWKIEGLCPAGRAAGSSGTRRGGDAMASPGRPPNAIH